MSTHHGKLIQSPFKTAIQAVCRLDLRIICGGHKAASAALALLIRWTEVKIEDFQREYDTYAIPEPDELWLTGNTIAKITSWMGGWFDEKTVRAGLSILEDLGYIDRRQDGGVDRTMAYLVKKDAVQERLSAITVEDAAKYIGREKAAETLGKSESGKFPNAKKGKRENARMQAPANSRTQAGKCPDDLYPDSSLDSLLDSFPPTPQGEPDQGVCEESPTALGTEPEQSETSATLPVKPEVVGTPQVLGQDKRSAAPKANPDRDKVWGGRFKHPAEAMEARFAAGANAPSRNNFAALQAEGMYSLVALGDEAWEVVRVVDGRVDFTELARAGARSISPDDVPEARVLRHLVKQSRKGTRTDWQILLDAGREAMAKKAQAEQVAVAREQQVVALPFQGDGYDPMAYAKMLNDRVMGAVAPVSVQAQKEAEPDAEPDSAPTDCADGTVPNILARMYSTGGNGIQVRAARIGLARTLVVEHGIDLEAVRLAVLDDLAAGKVARETAVTILRETLQTTDVAARIQAMAAQQPHNPHLAEPRAAAPEPAPVDQDAILNFLQSTEDSALPELIEAMEEKLKLLGLRTPFEQETWLIEHGQPYNWRGLAANQLKALIAFADKFSTQLAS